MTFSISWWELPNNIDVNFQIYCGLEDPEVDAYQYENNLKETLKQYHVVEGDGYILTFDSEAYYHWFILRFS